MATDFGSAFYQPIDWSGFTDIPKNLDASANRAREAELRKALAEGLPRGPGGVIDYNAAVDLAARTGNISAITPFAGLQEAQARTAEAAATHRETAEYHRLLAAQEMRPTIHWNPIDPLRPNDPQTGIAIYTRKDGTTRVERITAPPGSPQPATQPNQPTENPFDRPATNVLPNPSGGQPGASLAPNFMPPGVQPPPTMAQAPQAPPGSPSEQLLARAEDQPQQPQMPLPVRGPQLAQAGPAVSLPQVTVRPPGTPEPPAAPVAAPPPAFPPWLTQAQAPVVARPPEREAPSPLSADQKGELKFTRPLGPFNEDAIAQLPEDTKAKIRALASGRMNIMSVSPRGDVRSALQSATQAYFPNWDQGLYARRQQAIADFSRGKQGQTLRSVNNLTAHLETAQELMTALHNGDNKLWNNAVNKFRQVTGYEGELPNNVRVAAPIIAGEMVKVIAGIGGGGVGERLEGAANAMSTSSSPKMALGALNTIKHLMMGQLQTLHLSYENNTYNTDFDQKLLPRTRKLYEDFNQPTSGNPPAADYKVINVR